MRAKNKWWRLAAVLTAFVMLAAACGSDDDDGGDEAAPVAEEPAAEDPPAEEPPAEEPPAEEPPAEEPPAEAEATEVRLQLQWVPQSQFAGYFAALDQGFYEELGLDVTILEGSVDIVPATVLDSGAADFAVSWVPRGLVPREEGLNITNIAQVFQRSATLQVSFADSGITGPADLEGKNVGNWGFGNEFELLAGLRSADLDPNSDVTLVQQSFDMTALLNGDIDAAQAMIYNEFAQVLETVNPETGELYQPEDLTIIDWNDVGTAMLQDALWADADRLEDDPAYRETAVKFVQASLKGWIYCRDNFESCVQTVLAANPPFGGPSHQAWQLNEVNKLIWPSTGKVGVMDQAAWDRTVEIATSEGILAEPPTEGAFRTDIAEEAVANLEAESLDVTGESYTPTTVTLLEGGN